MTEAGFGADLWRRKILDIKVPNLPKAPDAVVIRSDTSCLKMHGGEAKSDLSAENCRGCEAGFANLKRHVENIKKFVFQQL